ncbi:MAG: RNA-binding S4 domain-containing protein [Clostridia bacterium]
MEKIAISTEKLKLDQFLKWASIVNSGGEAKEIILAGTVQVNGKLALGRNKLIFAGDIVKVGANSYLVVKEAG